MVSDGLRQFTHNTRAMAAVAWALSAPRALVKRAALRVLLTADPAAKMAAARDLLTGPPPDDGAQPAEVPDDPPLPPAPVLVPPGQLGRPRGVPLNVYLLHSLAHIEYGAVNSYTDTVARWCTATTDADGSAQLPGELFADALSIAADEATHFGWLADRLAALGSAYGALPAHDGLWRDAAATRGSLAARLVVLPLVAESRALDSHARLVAKLTSVGDADSARVVDAICREESRHVAVGVRWFTWLCARDGGRDPAAAFQELVRTYVRSPLPRPFNDAARAAAGLPPAWYEPVAMRPRT